MCVRETTASLLPQCGWVPPLEETKVRHRSLFSAFLWVLSWRPVSTLVFLRGSLSPDDLSLLEPGPPRQTSAIK